jgi:peptidoglycan hydrolase-like protein with peptidoglycan-binding domain
MKMRNRLVAMIVAAVFGTGSLVALAPAASAASYPACSTAGNYQGPTWTVNLPYGRTESGAFVINCWMRQGQVHSGVTALQVALNACEGKNLATDGDYGSLTAAAVRQVQGKYNLQQDGEYGTNTRNAMKWLKRQGERTICATL